MTEINQYSVAWNGQRVAVWPSFAEAEAHARQLEAGERDLFAETL